MMQEVRYGLSKGQTNNPLIRWKKFKLADSDGYVMLSNNAILEVKITNGAVCLITYFSNVYDVKDVSLQEVEAWLNGTEAASTATNITQDADEIQFDLFEDVVPDPECTPDNPKYKEAYALFAPDEEDEADEEDEDEDDTESEESENKDEVK